MLFNILHPLSNLFIFAGLIIIAIGWKAIHSANGKLVTHGIYRYVRHPQYDGFVLMIVGFLIQWPTIITILMAQALFIMYTKLAKKEEKNMIELFGEKYMDYSRQVPAFIPLRIRKESE